MTEAELLERWAAERFMYEAWGKHVSDRILANVGTQIAPMSSDIFIRIPPRPRVKGDASFLEKAFYRKNYDDPYAQITDKVGVRFVVLLTSQIPTIQGVIEQCPEWTASKDRDFEEEQAENPIQFDYAAVHYVVRCREALDVDGVEIAADTPCEVQIKTILQHAYSELTHDTIYKPKVTATPLMLRTAAKSMALIEATNDYFQAVVEQVTNAIGASKALTEELSVQYREKVRLEPEITRAEGLILEAFEEVAGEDAVARVSKFLDVKSFVSESVRTKAKAKLLYRQPSILLVYLLASERPADTKARWPLTPDELRPVYVDLGLSFDNF
jgi:putative GTP pyrophosphokinase